MAEAEATAPDDRPVFTVSEINHEVRQLLEGATQLQDVWLRGELSNYTGPHQPSGHLYFRMKDEDAEIDCVMWRPHVSALDIDPEEGMEVLARGSVGLYETRGSYQFYVEEMLQAGRGDLYLRYQMLKKQLAEEGLFDEARKQPLPPFPKGIGVVTSKSAAALQDLLNVLRRRSPHVHVLLKDARVQGEGAGDTIAHAINALNAYHDATGDLDVIVLTRGGGSMEDLWAFNEEVTVRAISNSDLPIIAGVGHETDWTLTDLAADQRAPTPSAAAEVAAPSRADTLERIDEMGAALGSRVQSVLERKTHRLDALATRQVLTRSEALLRDAWQRTDDLSARLPRAMQTRLETARNHLESLADRAVFRRPQALFQPATQRVQELKSRLPRALDRRLEQAKSRLSQQAGQLDALSPLKVLSRGYAVTTHEGQTVRSVQSIDVGDRLMVRWMDGRAQTRIEDTMEAQDE